MIDDQIQDLINSEMRNLFGGYDPYNDDIITLKAKIDKSSVYVYVVGKWRPVAYYSSRRIPGKRWQKENMIRTLRLSCKEIRDNKDKPIEFIWEDNNEKSR